MNPCILNPFTQVVSCAIAGTKIPGKFTFESWSGTRWNVANPKTWWHKVATARVPRRHPCLAEILCFETSTQDISIAAKQEKLWSTKHPNMAPLEPLDFTWSNRSNVMDGARPLLLFAGSFGSNKVSRRARSFTGDHVSSDCFPCDLPLLRLCWGGALAWGKSAMGHELRRLANLWRWTFLEWWSGFLKGLENEIDHHWIECWTGYSFAVRIQFLTLDSFLNLENSSRKLRNQANKVVPGNRISPNLQDNAPALRGSPNIDSIQRPTAEQLTCSGAGELPQAPVAGPWGHGAMGAWSQPLAPQGLAFNGLRMEVLILVLISVLDSIGFFDWLRQGWSVDSSLRLALEATCWPIGMRSRCWAWTEMRESWTWRLHGAFFFEFPS